MRINFLVDGFNLYHAIRLVLSTHKVNTKWLDIKSLCTSYLHLFGKTAVVNEIHYFSALPYPIASLYGCIMGSPSKDGILISLDCAAHFQRRNHGSVGSQRL